MDYKSQPIPAGTLIDDLHPSRFLKPYDLTERWKVYSLTVTISRLAYEETVPNPRDLDPSTADAKNPKGKPRVVLSPVMYFQTRDGNEFPRGMLVSAKENVTALKAATGARTTGDLPGKRVTLIVGEHKRMPVLRISPEKPPATSEPNNEQTPGK